MKNFLNRPPLAFMPLPWKMAMTSRGAQPYTPESPPVHAAVSFLARMKASAAKNHRMKVRDVEAGRLRPTLLSQRHI
jgi:hypothetical protein